MENVFETQGYVVRLSFDVFDIKGSYRSTGNWYYSKGELVPEIYNAWIFPSQEKAVVQFYAGYRTIIANFISENFKQMKIVKQWDGFAHTEQLYTKTVRTDQYNPLY